MGMHPARCLSAFIDAIGDEWITAVPLFNQA